MGGAARLRRPAGRHLRRPGQRFLAPDTGLRPPRLRPLRSRCADPLWDGQPGTRHAPHRRRLLRLQRPRHDHRRIRLHAHQRFRLVRRIRQPADPGYQRSPADLLRTTGREFPGLPVPLPRRGGLRRLLRRHPGQIRHPHGMHGLPALRCAALHLPRKRLFPHPERPGVPHHGIVRAPGSAGPERQHGRRPHEIHAAGRRLG